MYLKNKYIKKNRVQFVSVFALYSRARSLPAIMARSYFPVAMVFKRFWVLPIPAILFRIWSDLIVCVLLWWLRLYDLRFQNATYVLWERYTGHVLASIPGTGENVENEPHSLWFPSRFLSRGTRGITCLSLARVLPCALKVCSIFCKEVGSWHGCWHWN